MPPGKTAAIVTLVLAGACTSGASTNTGPPLTRSTIAVTTTSLPVITTVPATSLPPPSSLPDVPVGSDDWSVEPGDLLVSSVHGVRVVRDGAIVSRPVSSPVEAAVADESGAIVFVTPNPELFPDRWPGRDHGGGQTLWRLHPDGSLELVLRADGSEGPDGDLTLLQVEIFGSIAEEFPSYMTTPILIVDPVSGPDLVWLAPNHQPSHWPRPYESEIGDLAGAGWRDGPYPGGELYVAIRGEGKSWLERWTLYIGVSPWNTNPVPRGTPCRDDPSLSDCLDTVTTLPGTSLIAYTETDSQHKVTELVIYDLQSGTETRRVQVAEDPISVKQLHASDTQIVISLVRPRGDIYEHLPALVIDLESDIPERLPVPGLTTIVR